MTSILNYHGYFQGKYNFHKPTVKIAIQRTINLGLKQISKFPLICFDLCEDKNNYSRFLVFIKDITELNIMQS